MLETPPKYQSSFNTRNVFRIIAVVCVTALVASQVSNQFSTGENPDAHNAMVLQPVEEDNHHHSHSSEGVFESCDYIRATIFSQPTTLPSCTWTTPTESVSYECVGPTKVKKITYTATGCKRGTGTKKSEEFISNGQNGAVVDCSKKKSCSALWAIVASSVACPRTVPLSTIKSLEKFATAVCFDFLGPKMRYGCDDNGLVTDFFDGSTCTGTFYRSKTRSCYAGSPPTSANIFRCSKNTMPPDFPEPYLKRETSGSCGSLADPAILLQLNTCYSKRFQIPVTHTCNGKTHVETMYDSVNCQTNAVSESLLPTGKCINGKFEEECEGKRSELKNKPHGGIPKNEAIVGEIFGTADCSGTGITIRIKKNYQFSFQFKKIKVTCSNGQVQEFANGQVSASFPVGQCKPAAGAIHIGKNVNGLLVGKFVKFQKCP